MKYINGVPRIIYVENGIEKSSIDENKRMNEIDELNRRLFNRNEDETKEIESKSHGRGYRKIIHDMI